MKKKLGILNCFIIVLLIVMPSSAVMADDAPERLCKESDLTGTFFLEMMVEKPPGEESQWLHQNPYHYLLFKPEMGYDYVASQKKIKTLKQLQDISTGQTVGLTHTLVRKYTLDAQGLLAMTVDERPEYNFRCLVAMIKNRDGTEPGDLILLGYTKKNAELRKVFRPIEWQ